MALIQRDRQRNAQLAAAGAGAGIIGQLLAPQQIRAVARAFAEQIKSQPSSNKPKKQHKRASRSSDSTGGGVHSSGSITTLPFPNFRVKSSFATPVLNTTLNVAVGRWMLAIQAPLGAGVATLGSANSRVASLGQMYRRFRLHSIKVKWVPNCTQNDAGTLAMCVDADTFVGNPTSSGALLTRHPSCMTTMREGCTLVWKPDGPSERLERYTNLAGMTATPDVTRSVDDLSFGSLLLYCTNTFANATFVGNLVVEYDMTFSDAV